MDENTDSQLNQSDYEAAGIGQSDTKKRLVKIGLPVIIAQIVVAYLLASYVIVPIFFNKVNASIASAEQKEHQGGQNDVSREFGVIYKVQDVIVNPAESKGSQFILVNLAFEVREEEDVDFLKKREAQVRDGLISIVSSKTIEQLDGPQDKERLRLEIREKFESLLPTDHLYNVYFINYIIQ